MPCPSSSSSSSSSSQRWEHPWGEIAHQTTYVKMRGNVHHHVWLLLLLLWVPER